MILNRTDRIIQTGPKEPEQALDDAPDGEEEDVEEPEVQEEVTTLDEVADFESFTVWGHESVPDERDTPLVRGVSEWIKFAEAVSLPDFSPSAHLSC